MLTRRTFIAGFIGAAATPAFAAGEHPSVSFMRQVGKELLSAHRKGTVPAFMRVVQRYADVPEISTYSLGRYAANLQNSQRGKYQRGVATYMSRYFALQSRDYTVAKYEVGEATVDANKNVVVESVVFLMTGQSYKVSWQLVWRGGAYKVRDAKVLGFSLTSLQRDDFTSYLNKRNGNIAALIVALNGK